jgi:hypothetical protein
MLSALHRSINQTVASKMLGCYPCRRDQLQLPAATTLSVGLLPMSGFLRMSHVFSGFFRIFQDFSGFFQDFSRIFQLSRQMQLQQPMLSIPAGCW